MFKKNLITLGFLTIIFVVFIMYKSGDQPYKIFGNEVNFDLNQDGIVDTVHIVTNDSEGSGTFYYVTSSIKGTTPFFIGDRIAPQPIQVDMNGLITINYADRKPEESFATPPSIGKSLFLVFNSKDNKFYGYNGKTD